MAIPLMEDDVEVISQLGDTPGSDDGLTAQQLKGRFDLAGVRIKNFINNTLIPHLNQLVDVQALLDGILDTSLSLADKAANAKTTGEKIAEVLRTANAALPKSGGYMTGVLNMNNQQLTGLPTPVAAGNAVPKSYVDTSVYKTSLTVADWVGTAAPYHQTITVDGLTAKKVAHAYPVYTLQQSQDLLIMEACACVSYAVQSDNQIRFYCLTDKPEMNIPVCVEVRV